MSTLKNLLVYGGTGALGRSVVSHFKTQMQNEWKVISVDMRVNEEADTSIDISKEQAGSWQSVMDLISIQLDSAHIKNLDALVCVAGGWCGGNAKDQGFIETVEKSLHQSLQSSTIAASLAANRLNPGGLLVLTGAQAALTATPGMIGYGLTKAAIHHLVMSLGSPDSGMAKTAKVIAILPSTLDTPMNRKSMPSADMSTWTPLEHVSKQIGSWVSNSGGVTSGSLFKVVTQKSETTFVKATITST